ncbi:carbohydrate kinase [Nitrospirillum sp. BR 11164]|uniref:carbohydrate kinase n=1 Tax=Nitrospirillum sp. BR 11164 TaxID=3104324 RepID=UPI002AFEF529|nr:carbohydrate kinase [Nitrospirillum sp. BR 11164]MEA1651125.1 carbohydrate kinase [Nitrospirillum sp. BR 11164]
MTNLSDQERAVLAAIEANPFVSQQDMADTLGLARSTVAAHVVSLTQKGRLLGRGYILPAGRRVVCLGGAVLDRKYQALAPLVPATSNPVTGVRSPGGVARNVAENLARLAVPTALITLVGEDEAGREILNHLRTIGVDVSQAATTAEATTAEYAAILGPDGDLAVAAADMRIFDLFTPALLDRAWPHLAAASWVFADCNLPAETVAALVARRRGARFRLAIDAVSIPKLARLPPDLAAIDLLFMNLEEANALLGTRHAGLEGAQAAAQGLRARGAAGAVVTLGAQGTAIAGDDTAATFAAIPAQPVDTTGAGDAMIAGTLHRLVAGDGLLAAARTGALVGALTTESKASVHPGLSPQLLAANLPRLTT